MVHAELATAADAIFDLDFHAVMHWGHDPVLEKALPAHTAPNAPAPCSPSSPRTPAPTLVYANADLSEPARPARSSFTDPGKPWSGTARPC